MIVDRYLQKLMDYSYEVGIKKDYKGDYVCGILVSLEGGKETWQEYDCNNLEGAVYKTYCEFTEYNPETGKYGGFFSSY